MKTYHAIVMAPQAFIIQTEDINDAAIDAKALRDQFPSARLPNGDVIPPYLHSIYDVEFKEANVTTDLAGSPEGLLDPADAARRSQPYFDTWFEHGPNDDGHDNGPRAA